MIRSGTAASGTCTGSRADGAGGRRRRCAGDDRRPLIDVNGDEAGMREAASSASTNSARSGLDRTGACPAAIYTVSEESLRWIAELAARAARPRSTFHRLGDEQEVQDCVAAHGERPAAYLDRLGSLTARTLLATASGSTRRADLVAERGATVVTNPAANMKLAVGAVFPTRRRARPGSRSGSAPTERAPTTRSTLLADLKLFALAQKHARRRPHRDRRRGRLGGPIGAHAPCSAPPRAVGARRRRRLLLLRAAAPELAIGELPPTSSRRRAAPCVDTTVVAGRVLMRGGEVPELEGSSPAPARPPPPRL